jgi:hypothetical protein
VIVFAVVLERHSLLNATASQVQTNLPMPDENYENGILGRNMTLAEAMTPAGIVHIFLDKYTHNSLDIRS